MSRPYGAGEVFTTAQLTPGPVTVSGGSYIFAQTATGYGTNVLQVLGPDGTTYKVSISKAVDDTGDGTAVNLASGSQVRVVSTGTTAPAYRLARVPTA